MRARPRLKKIPRLTEAVQINAHRQTRQAHNTELAEDYVEVIADLISTVGEARIVDIARRLGVTHVTVNKTVGRLRREGLVIAQPYRSIFLTPSGEALANACRERHQIVYAFLLSLGVSEKNAAVDAEGIEHHVSDETLRAFIRETKR